MPVSVRLLCSQFDVERGVGRLKSAVALELGLPLSEKGFKLYNLTQTETRDDANCSAVSMCFGLL
jgi:hypothetical protein